MQKESHFSQKACKVGNEIKNLINLFEDIAVIFRQVLAAFTVDRL